jgi:hypothetical protein
MKKSIAVGVVFLSSACLALSGVAAAAGPAKDMNAPRPAAKDVHIAGASNISGWAVVEADGTLTREDNATGVIHLSTGTYEVDFNSKLKHCAWTAMISNSGSGTPLTGFIKAAARAGNIKGVFIATYDTAGAAADLPFHLNVTCS